VQVSWMGYLNTTGLPTMDYRICDAYAERIGVAETLHTEQLFRVPHSQWCYAPWYATPLENDSRPSRDKGLLFGSFNQHQKITDACLDTWGRVLRALPRARLMIMDVDSERTRRILQTKLAARGVAQDRVTLRRREDILTYFRAIASVDVALDSFPYNGATTTLDTLWMGTPIVGLAGDRGVARGTFSILKSLEANELIAHSTEEYVDLNVRLATDDAWRRQLHTNLRPRMAASPLMDAPRFVRDLEAGFRQMWRSWCDAQSGRS
jgi:protein O-GlcNAc transferase